MSDELAMYQRMLERERVARREAERILEEKSSALYDSNQKLLELNAMLESRVVEATSNIRQNEQQLQQLFDRHPHPMVIFGLEDNRILAVNQTAITNYGYSESEFLTMRINDLHFSDELERLDSHLNHVREGQHSTTQWKHKLKDGGSIDVEISANSITYNQLHARMVLMQDVSERRRSQLALIRSEEKYRGIIENLRLGLLEVDVEDHITKAYPKFCEMTGYSAEELEGKKATETLLNPKFAHVMSRENEMRLDGKSGVYEVQIKRKDGRMLWVIISGAPFYNEHMEVAGTIGIHLDISEQKALESALITAKNEAEHAKHAQELFMANMSHEIRTPMNAIIGMSQLLNKTALDSTQERYVDAIKVSADNLLVIINDILDFSKIEAGKLKLEQVDFDLPQLLEQSWRVLALKAEENGLLYYYKIDPAINPYVQGDPTRLNQVLLNLLSNAVKFTEQGEVSVHIDLLDSNAQRQKIRFSVKDTGIGVPQAKIQEIFKSFKQADGNTTRKFGGTGLGLAISRELVQLMGGDIYVKSVEGEGSEFYFDIPMSDGDADQVVKLELSEELEKDETPLRNVKVLLVEDHEINRFMATTILENWHCQVDFATTGKEAVAQVKTNNYDIILMDLQMPEMNGLEATKVIRTELLRETPIIALTANAIKGEKDKCFQVGMNAYVSKPFDHEELQLKMKTLLGNQEDVATSTPAREWVNLSGLEKMTMGNKDFQKQMISLFVEKTPAELEEMRTAVNAGEFEQVSRIAHRLKSSVQYVGHPDLHLDIREIEAWNEKDEVMQKRALNAIEHLYALIEQLQASL